jgi:hypothetical protein
MSRETFLSAIGNKEEIREEREKMKGRLRQ